jgi:hypothetical protein
MTLVGVIGKAMYHTSIELSDACMMDLGWWHDFLEANPGNASHSGTAGTLLGTWGDGSGTGTGGTIEEQEANHMDTWMGTSDPRVQHSLPTGRNYGRCCGQWRRFTSQHETGQERPCSILLIT